MTSQAATMTDEVRDYLAHVAARLASLPAEDRAELLDDLEQHLLEVAAEDGPSLTERLGPPDVYAAELLTSAGYEPDPDADTAATPPAPVPLLTRLVDMAKRLPIDALTAELAAYRPVWWVARGYIMGWMLADLATDDALRLGWMVFPDVEREPLIGALLVLVGVVASVVVGRTTMTRPWPPLRAVVTVANAAILVFALSLASEANGRVLRPAGAAPASSSYQPCMRNSNGQVVRNIYAYDAEGKPIEAFTLYDDTGVPLDSLCSPLDVPRDAYGRPVVNAYPRPSRDLYSTPSKSGPPAIGPPRLTTTTTIPPTTTTTTMTP